MTKIPDYVDADVAYLLGLIIARGTLSENAQMRQLTIQFPFTNLRAEGIALKFDQETSIRLGLEGIRERLLELLDTDISIIRKKESVDFVVRILRNSMAWRNINLLLEGQTSYQFFHLPPIILSPELPVEVKREFVRGFADAAGNIRHSNRYVDGRHRVRLDILNFKTNWGLPVQLCTLLQEHLNVPVQLITWGHPNLGRAFREHQLNIFAEQFAAIGFTFEHKQKILEEFVVHDRKLGPIDHRPCPGMRRLSGHKPKDQEENSDKLDPRLTGKHFDAYWQICKALGCIRTPPQGYQLELVEPDVTDADKLVETEKKEESNALRLRARNVSKRRRVAKKVAKRKVSKKKG